jgi:hypothetical protein
LVVDIEDGAGRLAGVLDLFLYALDLFDLDEVLVGG